MPNVCFHMETLTQIDLQLAWKTPFSTSCMHAAHVLDRGQEIVDSDWATAIRQPASALCQAITTAGVPRTAFWRHLVGLSIEIENNRQLAHQTLTKTIGGTRAEHWVDPFGGLIADLEAAGRRAAPGFDDILVPSVRMLGAQWSNVGVPLMQRIAVRTDARLVVPRAVAAIVWPLTNGGGDAHLLYNCVHIEADTDPNMETADARLPEIARLGWLLAQLNLDLPIFCDAVNLHRLPLVARLAMVPPTLEAAEQLELIRPDSITIDEALAAWDAIPAEVPDAAELVADWWATYQESTPRWEVALTALDHMIGGS